MPSIMIGAVACPGCNIEVLGWCPCLSCTHLYPNFNNISLLIYSWPVWCAGLVVLVVWIHLIIMPHHGSISQCETECGKVLKKALCEDQSPQNVGISGSRIPRKVLGSEEGFGLDSRALSRIVQYCCRFINY